MQALIFVLIGVAVGVFSGMVGIGGGLLIIPTLVYGFHYSQHKAQGTSLAALLLPIGIFAFWEYYKAGNAELRPALFIALGFAVGGWFGGMWAQHVSDLTMRRVFATFLVIVAVKMFLQK